MAVKDTTNGIQLENEASAGAHVPFTCHVDPHTLKSKDGGICQVVKLEGVAFETADTDQLDAWKNSRNFLFRSLAHRQVSLWTHLVRYKKSEYPAGEYEEGFAGDLSSKYKESIKQTEMFVNDLYISVVVRPADDKATSLFTTLKGFVGKQDFKELKYEQKKLQKILDDSVMKLLKGLSEYNPRLLGVYNTSHSGVWVQNSSDPEAYVMNDKEVIISREKETELSLKGELLTFSEPLEFMGFLINGSWKKIPLAYKNVGDTLLASKLNFEKEYFVRSVKSKKECGTLLSIKEYVNGTNAGILDNLLSLPVEFVLTQSFTFLSKQAATTLVSRHRNRMVSTGDLAESQIIQLNQALDQLTANHFCMGDHHFTLLVTASSQREMVDSLGLCDAELSEFGLITAREYLGLEAAFWAQIPGNSSYITRKAPITSLNFASFFSMHNFPQGKISGNHWGDCVSLLKTSSLTPYYFNFHYPKDLGNSTVIGPSGAGKTVLMLFLQAMSEKYKPQQIVFDKDRGAEIFIRAQKGSYFPIEAGLPTGMNPFRLEETPANKKFLREFLEILLKDGSNEINAIEKGEINTAVNGIFKTPEANRNLSTLNGFFQPTGENCLKDRLKPWLKKGDRGWVFDNVEDNLNLDTRLIGFDVTDFLEDPIIRTPLLMYLFHRIDKLLDGTKTSITLDEGWKLLDDEYFSKAFKNWLKVIRKRNGFTVFGTQEPSDVLSSAVGKTIMSQSPTQIFLPNPKADEKDYIDGFKLTRREYTVIRQLGLESRRFLIKQGNESVIAELNLGGMDDEIAVLSGTTENVNLIKRIREDVGEDPKDWLPEFHNQRN